MNFSMGTSSSDPIRVCIVGAGGPSGLVTLRHLLDEANRKVEDAEEGGEGQTRLEVMAFESSSSVGGVWTYDEGANGDEVISHESRPMYENLRTNLPIEVMGYLDYPWFKDPCPPEVSPSSSSSFVHHSKVLEYFKDYATDFNLWDKIQFNSYVTKVRPTSNNPKSTKWSVTVQRRQIDNPLDSSQSSKVNLTHCKTEEIIPHEFDSVVICTGHSNRPHIPRVPGLDSKYTGKIIHSVDYKSSKKLFDACPWDSGDPKRALILGGGHSGTDIGQELSEFCDKVFIITRKDRPNPEVQPLPKNLQFITSPSGIECISDRGLKLDSGQVLDSISLVVICTGYEYSYPFLDLDPSFLDLTSSLNGHKNSMYNGEKIPLIHLMAHESYTSLWFIGIPGRICPCPCFDIQARYYTRYIREGSRSLPSLQNYTCSSTALTTTPILGSLQWDYYKALIAGLQLKSIPVTLRKRAGSDLSGRLNKVTEINVLLDTIQRLYEWTHAKRGEGTLSSYKNTLRVQVTPKPPEHENDYGLKYGPFHGLYLVWE